MVNAKRNVRARKTSRLRAAVKLGMWRAVPRLVERLQKPAEQEFAISVYRGHSLAQLAPVSGATRAALTWRDVSDVPSILVADPFLCPTPDRWYMFFEVLDSALRRGVISVASSEDTSSWIYDRVVLTEPFHLSYPHVFETDGTYYMIPETAQAASVRLYKAVEFPCRWECVGTLLDGESFVDSSVFFRDGLWWLFTATTGRAEGLALRLYFSEHLQGPWREHPASPVVESCQKVARPAGRVVIDDGHPVRFAQSAYPDYGTAVHALRVTELSPSRFAEELWCPDLLAPGSESWNSNGMHHIDAWELPDGSWLASVDGWRKNGR